MTLAADTLAVLCVMLHTMLHYYVSMQNVRNEKFNGKPFKVDDGELDFDNAPTAGLLEFDYVSTTTTAPTTAPTSHKRFCEVLESIGLLTSQESSVLNTAGVSRTAGAVDKLDKQPLGKEFAEYLHLLNSGETVKAVKSTSSRALFKGSVTPRSVTATPRTKLASIAGTQRRSIIKQQSVDEGTPSRRSSMLSCVGALSSSGAATAAAAAAAAAAAIAADATTAANGSNKGSSIASIAEDGAVDNSSSKQQHGNMAGIMSTLKHSAGVGEYGEDLGSSAQDTLTAISKLSSSASALMQLEEAMCDRHFTTLQVSFLLLCFMRKFSADTDLQDTLVELVVSIFPFITNLVDIGDVITLLQPAQQAELYYRIGWLNLWNPIRPDGYIELNLLRREERQIAKLAMHLLMCDGAVKWCDEEYSFKRYDLHLGGWQLPKAWLTESALPSRGVLCFTLVTNSNNSNNSSSSSSSAGSTSTITTSRTTVSITATSSTTASSSGDGSSGSGRVQPNWPLRTALCEHVVLCDPPVHLTTMYSTSSNADSSAADSAKLKGKDVVDALCIAGNIEFFYGTPPVNYRPRAGTTSSESESATVTAAATA
jgi:hypothetical protein